MEEYEFEKCNVFLAYGRYTMEGDCISEHQECETFIKHCDTVQDGIDFVRSIDAVFAVTYRVKASRAEDTLDENMGRNVAPYDGCYVIVSAEPVDSGPSYFDIRAFASYKDGDIVLTKHNERVRREVLFLEEGRSLM